MALINLEIADWTSRQKALHKNPNGVPERVFAQVPNGRFPATEPEAAHE